MDAFFTLAVSGDKDSVDAGLNAMPPRTVLHS